MYIMYGIANCDTVKKAKQHLDSMGLAYEFIDFKKSTPTKEDIMRWKESYGDWPVNKRGPTYRKIKDEFEKTISETQKIKILIHNTSAIKRPILIHLEKDIIFGYDANFYNQLK